MSEQKAKVSNERIEEFLEGSDQQKYIVSIEASYSEPMVTLVINDPELGKYTEDVKFKPFLWFKEEIGDLLYNRNKKLRLEMGTKYGVTIKRLKTANSDGISPKRLQNGYKYIAICTKSYNHLVRFFKDGGFDVFDKEFRENFVMFSPVEQFMIQTGKRLFKGVDDYDGLHRFQFDLETEGLFANKNAIFQIGVRDNRGMDYLLETEGESYQQKRDSERAMIDKFFKIIDIVKPDIIAGYNSENFDWPFIFERAERLSIPVTELAITLNRLHKIKRKSSTVKFGGETEIYQQTSMFGYNIIDISHAVRRAMAINSEIKAWGLKYITQYSEIAKPNRVYVQGDKINTTWADNVNKYAFNDTDGDWYMLTDKKPLKNGYEVKTGAYIVQRYLSDDLWETEQIDNIFNQASFLIGKMLPTTYQRSSTMGTAGQWKLIMSAWSYENGLAIPETQKKRDFTGGLARLLEVGYARDVVKLDFAALYPKIQLTHLIFPDLDITGMMEGTLTYVVDTRDKYKFLTGEHKYKYKSLEKKFNECKSTISDDEIDKLKKEIDENKALANLYDKKQLPLKILANSWFGSYGAPYIFNWGDTDSAEETTCRGRQYLRLMVKHFTEKHGFRALVGDSVTYDTPVYIRYSDGTLDIKPICDLFNEDSECIDLDGLRDYEAKSFEVLTVNGWKNINYVYRHGTDKQIHRVTTKDRLVNVTEDHSLFQDGIQIKPSTLKRGDSIDVYNQSDKFDSLSDLSEDQAWLYGFFLGDGSANCSARTRKYISRKTGKTHINKDKRSDWKISNTRLDFLEKLRIILEKEFGIIGLIKDHMKSSSVYNLVVHKSEFTNQFCNDFYTSYREKKVPSFILNSNEKIKTAFLNGVCASDGYGDDLDTCSSIGMKSQVAMAGLSILFNELNIEYKIVTRKDKQNFISFILKNHNRNNSSFTNKTLKKTNEVWKNEVIYNNDKNNFVYDISTEDGTFIGGIGLINLKNTDGFNFASPPNINDIKYVAKGSHWKTDKNGGVELIGLEAVLAEFNEKYMKGRMGLDIDDVCNSTINFARKNYANDIGGKIKLVGNSVKSKKMSVYIEEFLGKAIRMLLDGDGYSFINFYYEYVDKIYNYQIPLVKIASKAKVKSNINDYKAKSKKLNKAGNPMPKQAHMELAIRENLDITLGDVLYYINTGSAKSHGDLKTIDKNKMTKKQKDAHFAEHGVYPQPNKVVELNCKLIDPETVESDFELVKELNMLKVAIDSLEDDLGRDEMEKRMETINNELYTDEYNVARYLEAFNKKVRPLLVCFHPDIRSKILLDIVKTKDKITKKTTEKLKERMIFVHSECGLVCGMANKASDQDSYEDLMKMEDKEIRFWDSVDKIPNNMDESEWETIRLDWKERMRIAKIDGIKHEQESLDEIFKHLEVSEFNHIINTGELPKVAFIIADISEDFNTLISRKWGEVLCPVSDIFKYEIQAIERDKYYKLVSIENLDNRYQEYLDYLNEQEVMTGKTMDMFTEIVKTVDVEEIIPLEKDTNTLVTLLKEKAAVVVIEKEEKKKRILSESESEDDGEVSEEEDDNGDMVRTDDIIQLDDEIDDTYAELPDDYEQDILIEPIIEEIEEDEWGF
jgi:DNA polymerase elongation subunit (family B)